MTEQYAIAALVRKRAEIGGQIERTQAALRQLIIDLDNVDATLRIFDPNIELETIKPSAALPWQQAFRGEIYRIVVSALRTSPRPMSAYELAMQVMATKQVDTTNKRLVDMFGKRVGAVLRHHRESNKVRSLRGPSRRILWEIVR